MTDLILGIDLGGTNMQLGVVTPTGEMAAQHKKKTRADLGADQVFERVVEAIEETCEMSSITPRDLRAIGLAAAGALDHRTGVIFEAPNIGWRDFAIAKALQERVGAPVSLENDVNAAAIGELRFGALRGERDALCVWVGTGVGGAFILNGALYRGAFGTAGEIGHVTLFPGAALGWRKVEENCSRSAVVDRLARLSLARQTELTKLATKGVAAIKSSGIARAYELGDPLTCEVVDEAADLLGVAIGSAVTLMSLPVVALGGGLTEAIGQPFVDRVAASVKRHVFPHSARQARIVVTALLEKAGILGAAAIACDEHGLSA